MSSFQSPGDWSLSEAVGKRLLTPGGAVAPGVAPELMPVVVLENDRPENMLLSYQRMFSRSANIAAGGAGTRASVRLVNNRADLLVTVDWILCAVQYQVCVERGAVGATPFGAAAQGFPRDTRIAQAGGALTTMSTATIVSDATLAGLTTRALDIPANIPCEVPFVIGPGDHLVVQAVTDAQPLTGWNIVWRERRLNPSERI